LTKMPNHAATAWISTTSVKTNKLLYMYLFV
jgi:hypothetical protein